MTDDRDDGVIRQGALLVSSLLLTPDAGLEAFRERRLANDQVDADQLKRVREVLDGVAFALAGKSVSNWQRVDDAWSVLRKNTPPKLPKKDSRPPPVVPTYEPRSFGKADAADPAEPSAPAIAFAPELASEPTTAPEPPIAAAPLPSHAYVPTPVAATPVRAPPPPLAYEPAPASAGPPSVTQDAPAGPGEPLPDSYVLPFAGAPPLADPPRDAPSSPEQGLPDEYVLPFSQRGPAIAPEPMPEPVEQHGALGQTAYASVDDPESALPFEQLPELTLEQYASLWAERSLTKDRATLLQRYQLPSAAAADRLHVTWRKRFMEDAALKARFDQLVAHYLDWVQNQRR